MTSLHSQSLSGNGRGTAARALAIAALLFSAPGLAASRPPAPTGSICIAPFHAEHPFSPGYTRWLASRVPLSTTTWGPSWNSKFTFRVNRTITATVANDQRVHIKGVPADRKVLVEIRLDGKPYEAFRLDLRKRPDRHVCLWLYED
ncbi:MAG TPA: hypothetical protein VGX68_07910 [Thermoanaerobaculia bacterium]|jgi:hypothetical protein|nr:hypothetical protein [Thermoanaerobaculia bacterium]